MTPIVIPPLAYGFLFVAVIAGPFAVRARRIRRWEEILSQPAAEFATRKAKWKAKLPRGISLKSRSPLFEILYADYKSKPKSFEPYRVKDALVQAESIGTPGRPRPDGDSSDDDEKINNLVGLRNYHQNPGYMPVEAVAASVLRNLVNVLKGKKKLKVGLEHAVLDSFEAGGGLAGAKLGSVAGMTLAPLIASMGAWVLPILIVVGAWFGSIAGRKIGNRVKARRIYAAMKKLKAASKSFRKCFLDRFPKLMEQLDHEYEARVAFTLELYRRRQNRLTRLFFPDVMSTFFQMSLKRIRRERDEDKKQWKLIRRKIRFMNSLKFIYIMRNSTEKSFLRDPDLLAHYQAYESALQELQDARKTA